MKTILIQIKDPRVYKLLQDLEELNLIRLLDTNIEIKEVNLSDKYKNVFTKDEAKDFILHTESMRKEWENT